MTGKTFRDASGAIAGRFRGGFTILYPEVARAGLTPGEAASAVERGTGKRFTRLVLASKAQVEKEIGPERKRSKEKPTIPPHAGRKRCVHCGVIHAKGQHRFHGAGAFHKTHLFGFHMNKPTCNFCRGRAVARVRGYRLCLKCLKKACRLRGVKLPAKFATNPPAPASRKGLAIAGAPGRYYVVIRKGRQILRIVSGPFADFDKAVRYKNLYRGSMYRQNKRRRRKSSRRRSNPASSVPAEFVRFLESRGYLPGGMKPAILRELWKNSGMRQEFYQWQKGGSLFDRPTLFKENRGRSVRLGTALDIGYRREIGKYRGNYRHKFASAPGLYATRGRVTVR